MDNVFLHSAFAIFRCVFPLIQSYYLLPLIDSRGIWPKESVKQCLGRLYSSLLFLGLVLLWLYVVLHLTPYKKMSNILGLYAISRSLLVMVVIGSVYTVDGSHMRLFCSVAAPVLTVVIVCYRFIIIRLVISTKNVKSMPFLLCLFTFLSSALWLVFCLLERDFFAAIPNGFMSCLGAWQMLLYAKYRNLQPAN